MNFILIFFLGVLIFLNYYLFEVTKHKIEVYNLVPPFIWLDYTNSEWKNSNSKVKHLFDQNPNTFWIKERESKKEWDLDLELRLTHIFKNGIYIPRYFEKVKLSFCGKPVQWNLEIFLHEAINVDKELRFPNSIGLLNLKYETLEQEKILLLPKLNLQESKTLDSKLIFILGIRLKANELGGCISEIQLLEK